MGKNCIFLYMILFPLLLYSFLTQLQLLLIHIKFFFLFYFCWVAQKCAAQFFFMLYASYAPVRVILSVLYFWLFFFCLSCLLSFAFAPIQTIKETYLCKYCTFSPIQKHSIHLAALFYSRHSVLVGVSFGVFPRLIFFLELSFNKF